MSRSRGLGERRQRGPRLAGSRGGRTDDPGEEDPAPGRGGRAGSRRFFGCLRRRVEERPHRPDGAQRREGDGGDSETRLRAPASGDGTERCGRPAGGALRFPRSGTPAPLTRPPRRSVGARAPAGGRPHPPPQREGLDEALLRSAHRQLPQGGGRVQAHGRGFRIRERRLLRPGAQGAPSTSRSTPTARCRRSPTAISCSGNPTRSCNTAPTRSGAESAYPKDLATRADVNRWLLWEASAWFATCYVYLVENVVKPILEQEPDAGDPRGARRRTSTTHAQPFSTRAWTAGTGSAARPDPPSRTCRWPRPCTCTSTRSSPSIPHPNPSRLDGPDGSPAVLAEHGRGPVVGASLTGPAAESVRMGQTAVPGSVSGLTGDSPRPDEAEGRRKETGIAAGMAKGSRGNVERSAGGVGKRGVSNRWRNRVTSSPA